MKLGTGTVRYEQYNCRENRLSDNHTLINIVIQLVSALSLRMADWNTILSILSLNISLEKF